MRHVLCVSSAVAYGAVGNAAAVPALQAAGFTCLQLPTIILSNHPGLGKPAGVRLPAGELAAMLTVLEAQGVLASCAGVMTGYFASADQVSAVASRIAAMKHEKPELPVLIDPVLGDGDRLYVAEEVARAVRDELLPLATITTPNCFELGWLSDRHIATEQDATTAARQLGCAQVLATSIASEADLATLLVTATDVSRHVTARREHVPHGTGDFLSGLYFGAHLNGYAPDNALALASALLDQAIARSEGHTTLDVIGTLQGA